MRHGRILALDYGTKNVGLAAADELGVTIQPLASISNRNRRGLLERIGNIVRERGVETIVLGLPLNMDGSSGPAVERVQRFSAILRDELELPVWEFDERLSTVEAVEVWREMKPRQRRKYRTVDSLAAAFILDRFLKES